LAPTVGITATRFCYPGGILQLFHRRYQQIFSASSRSTTHTAEDSWSKDTEQYEEIKIKKFCGCRQQHPDYFNRSHLVESSSSTRSTSTILYIIKIFVLLRRQESSGSSKSSDRGTTDQAQRSHQLADYNSVEAKSSEAARLSRDQLD
jgi:hypothetical protein